MTQYKWTKHGTERMQQRGFTKLAAERLVQLADLGTPVGRDLDAFRLSHMALAEAVADGLPRALADRLTRRCVVIANDGAIITVAHTWGAKSRAYKRRDRRAFWK